MSRSISSGAVEILQVKTKRFFFKKRLNLFLNKTAYRYFDSNLNIFTNRLIFLFFKKPIRFESVYFTIFKKLLKQFFKNKKLVWLNCGKVKFLTKKPKNSRMGKGKGQLLRFYFFFSAFSIFAKFEMTTIAKLVIFKKRLNCLIKCKIFIYN